MQNCLHSKKASPILNTVLIMLIALAVAAVVLFTEKTKDESASADVCPRVLYLSDYSVNDSDEKEYSECEEVEMTEKMNNLSSEVAKIHVSDKGTGFEKIVCPENVRVLMKDGSVKTLELEEYIKGCVLGEMPLTFETQALMAQSIAARTFTVRRMLYGTNKHKSAPVCADSSCCQCYVPPSSRKLSEEQQQKLDTSISATRGIIAVYNGKPIDAAYHASSGECTLDSEDVWGGKVEYLRSVKSPEGEKELYENGYGHRVGLSQHGANLLAKEGKNYIEILKYYYSGVSLSFMQSEF